MRGLLALCIASCASFAAYAQPAPVIWSSRHQTYRDQEAPRGRFGPGSGDPSLSVQWTLPLQTTPAGILSEVVTDTMAAYALVKYVRYGSSTVAALSPSGVTLWSTDIGHGAMYYANAGLQLTSAGTLIIHSVSATPNATWHCITALTASTGTVAWVTNTSGLIYDHVGLSVGSNALLLGDYYGQTLTVVDAATGATTFTISSLCVAPVETLQSIACYCDGSGFYATHICGFSRIRGSQIFKVPVPAGGGYFPSSGLLAWTELGPVGYGNLIAPVVDSANATRLVALSPFDGTPTGLWPGAFSVALPWGLPNTIFASDLALSLDGQAAFITGTRVTTSASATRESGRADDGAASAAADGAWDARVRASLQASDAEGVPAWVYRGLLRSGGNVRCGDGLDGRPLCDEFASTVDVAGGETGVKEAGAARRAATHAPLHPLLQRAAASTSSSTSPALVDIEEAAPGAPVRQSFVTVSLLRPCLTAYTVPRRAGGLGVATTVTSSDGWLGANGAGQRGNAMVFIHATGADDNGSPIDQVEAWKWNDTGCSLSEAVGVAGLGTSGRFAAIGPIDGMVISSGWVAGVDGSAPSGSAIAAVWGAPHNGSAPPPPGPSPSPAPSGPSGGVHPAAVAAGAIACVIVVAGAAFFALKVYRPSALEGLPSWLGGADRRDGALLVDSGELGDVYAEVNVAGGAAAAQQQQTGEAGPGDIYSAML